MKNTILRYGSSLPLPVRTGFFLLLLALGGQPVLAQTPNPLTCSTTSYLFQSDITNIYEVDLTSGKSYQKTDNGIPGISSSPTNTNKITRLNAFGFNQNDNYIWGQVYGTQLIARIGKDANGNYLGQTFATSGLPTVSGSSNNFVVGDVSPSGIMYLAVGGSNSTNLIYVINLAAVATNSLTATTLPTTTTIITDWAVSPTDNNLYAISSNVGTNTDPAMLYRFLTADRRNSDGSTTAAGTREVLGQISGITADKNGGSSSYNFGSSFMDVNGSFYGVLNSTGAIYRIDSPDKLAASTSATPAATYVNTPSPAVASSNTDGARCSAAKVVPLPVTLTSFTAAAAPSRRVQLRWTTASERNNDYFEVQHSLDGQAFVAVGRVAGHQTTAQASAYAFADAAPGAAATHYYRLRQVDLDGSSGFSPVQVVALAAAAAAPGQLSVAPNPSTADGLRVQVYCPAATAAVLEVRSLLGQCVFRQALTLAAGANQLALSTQLVPGPYWLRLAGETGRPQGVKVFITN